MSSKLYKIEGIPVPLKLFIERRNNATVSVTPRNIIIRLPSYLSAEERQEIIAKHLEWAKKTIQEKQLFASFKSNVLDYHLKTITIYNTEFLIHVLESKTSKNKLSYIGNYTIELYLLKQEFEQNNVSLIKELLIKFTNKFFRNKIIIETKRLNELYFNEAIKDIKLKYSTSKWGACYPDRTLLFSTKLLLMPNEIIEYVIIHELAHLKEMNHSDRFWKLVKTAMPDYKKHVRWLKLNQGKYDF